ncbi:MAG: LPS assembly protein LptD [Sphingorhabdus sp.]
MQSSPKDIFTRHIRSFASALLLGSAALPTFVAAQDDGGDTPAENTEPAEQNDEIAFAAEKVVYDSNTDIVTATGDVVLNRNGYSLRADKVIWNRKSGEVKADGNIRSIGPDGSVAYGDSILLTDSLKDGMVENMLLVLDDGVRLAARKGERKADGSLSLDYAAYTPCTVTGKDGCPKNPTWQVRAVRVDYDPIKKRIKYKGARIELFGLPVIPLPGLSHPADSRAGSGFLVPNMRFSRNNGAEIEVPYYWRLASNRDLTTSITAFSEVAPLAKARFRTLEKKGTLEIGGYATYGRRLSVTGGPIAGERDIRGYLDGNGRFQFNENWSVSGSLRVASDRTFLRRYDISRDDRLRNNLSIERISDNSYFSVNGWATQTLRVGDRQGLQPIALPEVDFRLRLDDPLLGGKLQLQANSLLIGRTSGQDTQRAFASARWDLRKITRLGQEVSFTLLGRGDLYNSDENASTLTALYRGNPGFQTRGIFAAAAEINWPLIGRAFGGTQILKPRIQLVAANVSSNLAVPNEDARAVDLEDSNLFALNRFPGYDRFEDNYRITYGIDWSLRRKNLHVDFNIGQSYRLSNRNTILPDGTGLSEKVSDIVGRTEVRFKDLVKFTHRFRLDKDNFAIRRNEVDATLGTRGTYFKVGYLRLNRDIAGIEDLADREEVRLAGRITVARFWSIFGSAIVDLTGTSEDPLSAADGYQPIRHRLGIAYDDDCLSFGLTWRRDYLRTGDARRGNSFLLRLAFRNLGV